MGGNVSVVVDSLDSYSIKTHNNAQTRVSYRKLNQVDFTGRPPKYMTKGAAGADLESNEHYVISPGDQVMIDTGTCIQLPTHLCGLLMPRSSLCNKGGIMLTNGVGLLDSDYTESIRFVYWNRGNKEVIIQKGERVGQIAIIPFFAANFVEVDSLEETDRLGGFGSTGK